MVFLKNSHKVLPAPNLHKFKGLDLLAFLLVKVFLAIFGYREPAACNNEIRTLLAVANSFGHHFQGPGHTSKFGNKFFQDEK